VKLDLGRRLHDAITEVEKWLGSVVQGFTNYCAVPGNLGSLKAFRARMALYWLRTLRRRSRMR
jgi:hypothetical protein